LQRIRSGIERSGDPEAERVEADVDVPFLAHGRPDKRGFVAPGAATDDAVAWIGALNPGRPVRRRAEIGVVPAVLDPLLDVSMHVVESEGVGLERTGRRRLLKIPSAAAPVAIGETPAGIVPPRVAAGGAGARYIFPFGLRREAIALAGHP